MRHITVSLLLALLVSCFYASAQTFPDGTPIPEWFSDVEPAHLDDMGEEYVITSYGVKKDSTLVQTERIQAVIDKAAASGGGVVVIPKGTFLSGALFFKRGVNLYLKKGAVLKCSDDISDFPVMDTRMEGQCCKYFPALVNADGCDGFRMGGEGTINGNGLRYWKHFWQRLSWNPKATNKDEMRPRLLFVSNSSDVLISGLHLKDSPFWTTHFYRCDHVKLIGLTITSPVTPVRAPSSDACDIDACTDFLVHGCYMAVNDDAVVLKGGKGPWADTAPENGPNERIIVEDCEYGFCHGGLTCGSESIHDRNVILRRCKVEGLDRVLWFKMRVDTPQLYEYITVEDITGSANHFICVFLWGQFADFGDRKDIPVSYAQDILVQRCKVNCEHFFTNETPDDMQFRLSRFTFKDLDIKTPDPRRHEETIDGVTYTNCNIATRK